LREGGLERKVFCAGPDWRAGGFAGYGRGRGERPDENLENQAAPDVSRALCWFSSWESMGLVSLQTGFFSVARGIPRWKKPVAGTGTAACPSFQPLARSLVIDWGDG
jgi:hypothetical protein